MRAGAAGAIAGEAEGSIIPEKPVLDLTVIDARRLLCGILIPSVPVTSGQDYMKSSCTIHK